jgi:integral membrane protein
MALEVDLVRRVALLRATCVAETASFVALLIAMALHSEGGVSAIGLVHGLLFLAYAGLVVATFRDLGWSNRTAVLLILTGPVGAVICLEMLRREPAARAERAATS